MMISRKKESITVGNAWTNQKFLNEVGIRQLETRKMFRRLFRLKFGVEYHEFLSDSPTAQRILDVCPEAFGPKNYNLKYNTDGDAFLKEWLQAQDRKESFKDFFDGKYHSLKDKIEAENTTERIFTEEHAFT
jgi:hypothetical protein